MKRCNEANVYHTGRRSGKRDSYAWSRTGRPIPAHHWTALHSKVNWQKWLTIRCLNYQELVDVSNRLKRIQRPQLPHLLLMSGQSQTSGRVPAARSIFLHPKWLCSHVTTTEGQRGWEETCKLTINIRNSQSRTQNTDTTLTLDQQGVIDFGHFIALNPARLSLPLNTSYLKFMGKPYS